MSSGLWEFVVPVPEAPPCALGGGPRPGGRGIGRGARGRYRPPGPPEGTLARNSTSFPVMLAAKLRVLHDKYLLALSDPEAPDHLWVKLLRYYQYLVRAVYGDPTYGLGSDGNGRGLLLYLSTGIGKTRAAVGIAMAVWESRPVVVLLPRSLRQNMIDAVATVIRGLHPGASPEELAGLQAEAIARFSFVSMDAYNAAAQLARAGAPGGRAAHRAAAAGLAAELAASGGLDGKLLIVDEAHNLFRSIINSASEESNARKIYQDVMEARDLLIVFLTGTPAAKDPFELVPCFNMLAGYDLLPTLYETFYSMYVDRERNAIRNRGKLANRLVGLVSHVAHNLPTAPGGSGTEKATRDDGWFPEKLPVIVERVEMAPAQYRTYLLAREKEEAEGGGWSGPSGPVAPRLALPGAAKKAMGTYFVGSRSAGIFVPPERWRGVDVDEMPDECFTEATAPKLALIARRVAAARGPVLVYSQFVQRALRPLGRFLRKLGLAPFEPDLEAAGRALASAEVLAVSAEGLGALWTARPRLAETLEAGYRPPADLSGMPGTHYLALDPSGDFAAHALIAAAPGPHTPRPLIEAAAAGAPAGVLWLEEVFTREGARRRGFARAAIRLALASNPTMPTALVVAADNAPALAAYRGLGFAEGPEAPAPPGSGASGALRLMLRPAGRPPARGGCYAVISGDVPEAARSAIKAAEVLSANAHGEIIKAVLVSKTGAEGLDLKWIVETHSVEAYWDMARHDQVDARGVRLGSHDGLPRDEREVQPYIYLATANRGIWDLMRPSDREPQSIDEVFYERALARGALNLEFRRLLAEVSVECRLFGYGACRVCVPTGAPLFHEDPALDLRLPDPCAPEETVELAATPVSLDGETLWGVRDPGAPGGWALYRFDEALGGHVALDPGDPRAARFIRALEAAPP